MKKTYASPAILVLAAEFIGQNPTSGDNEGIPLSKEFSGEFEFDDEEPLWE